MGWVVHYLADKLDAVAALIRACYVSTSETKTKKWKESLYYTYGYLDGL